MPRAILPSVTSSSSLFLCSTSDLTRFLFYSVPVPVDNSTTHLSPILSLVYIYIYTPLLYIMAPKKATASTGATKKAAHASYRGMFSLILLHHHIASKRFWYRCGREYLLIRLI